MEQRISFLHKSFPEKKALKIVALLLNEREQHTVRPKFKIQNSKFWMWDGYGTENFEFEF